MSNLYDNVHSFMIVLVILFAERTLVFKSHITIFTIEYYKTVPRVEPIFLCMQDSRL